MEKVQESSKILKFLYNTVPGRVVLKLLTSPTISKIGGAYMNSGISKIHIKGFIKNNIDDNESANDILDEKISNLRYRHESI